MRLNGAKFLNGMEVDEVVKIFLRMKSELTTQRTHIGMKKQEIFLLTGKILINHNSKRK
jgi:hypothetical protein